MRKVIIIFVCVIVVLLLGYSGYRGYELWKQSHWMSLAKGFAAKGDAHEEFLCLEQALAFNSKNVEACRMMANLAEASHSPGALIWRQKVLELDPGSMADRLALAQTAVFTRDFVTASNALAGVDAAGKNTAAYYNIAGELALAVNKPAEAESDFAQAASLDPSNPAPKLSLAVVELHGTNALDMDEARISLKRIIMNSTNAAIRCQAQRELIMDALRFKDNETALSLSKELVQETNAIFADELMRLDVLKAAKSDEYSATLASYEHESASNPDKLYQLTLWLMEQKKPDQALGWLQSLPANAQTNQPAALLIAQCQMLTQDWHGLQSTASKENWGKLDFTRHAYLSRALREQGLNEASKAEWDVAVRSANGGYDDLTALFRLAAAWNWSDEAQQILWTIVNSFPQEQWATKTLAEVLYQSGSTRPLMQLFSTEVNRNPADLDAKNNLALTALLLRAQDMNPYALAREVYQKAPTNSYFACTYAFSLYLQGKKAEALKIMQQLTPQELNNNSTAGYYGVILKAAGDDANAKIYLSRATKGPLLPEERAMFQQAMSGL